MTFCFLIVLTIILFINIFPKVYLNRHLSSAKLDKVFPIEKLDNEKVFSESESTEFEDDHCEVIHVGSVCSGSNSIINFHTLLKSLYFYRINPIHFHILTNKASEYILRTLFDSWDVPQVNVTFYDMNTYITDIRWIPNTHYSGVHGLLKLLFPKIIPTIITKKILILDTDMTIVEDIYEIWKLFKKFNGYQAIGIVENQSDYYLGLNVWPAINRGFNSGVMLLNLEVLQQINWTKLWTRITKQCSLIYGATKLADQDIINAVLKNNHQLLYEVPCEWNIQLSGRTLSYNCYRTHKPKIIHWNSPKKYDVENRDGSYFRNVAMGFIEYNGNLFRKKLLYCEGLSVTQVNDSSKECSEFHNFYKTRWRTFLFFMDFKYTPLSNDITFVAHLSYDRLNTIEELVKSWPGSISLTIYVSDSEFRKTVSFISNSEVLKSRRNVAYHAVFRDGDFYPINKLRNIGLKNVKTPYVFLADIDFIPSKNLYEILKKHIRHISNMGKKALVVPAFEFQNYGNQTPKTKDELLKALDEKTVLPFLAHIWPSGHAPTNYDKWKYAIEPYKVNWKPDYEPYVVVKSNVVEYNEKFVGFGWNKVSHIMELEAQDYEFLILPDTFIIHKPHVPSYDIARFRSSIGYRLCLQMLKEEFIQSLNQKYNKNFEYSNSSVTMASLINLRRRKRNYEPNDHQTTMETNTDYPVNFE